jgi:Cu2+-exporting ATPase
MITGEPIPVNKSIDDKVVVNINGNQSFLMKTKKWAVILCYHKLFTWLMPVRSRAPIQNLADKVSGYFVPVVVIISLANLAVWVIWDRTCLYVYALVNAIAVLLCMSLCIRV